MSAVASIVLSLMIAADPDPAAVERAKSLYENGTRAYEAGRYLAAIAVFEEAYRLAPRSPLAYALAQAYRLQYLADGDTAKLKKALDLYQLYLEEAQEGPRRAQALEHATFLEVIWKRIQAELPPGEQPKTAAEAPAKGQLIVTSA